MEHLIKKVKTRGIEYIEPLEGSDSWYWGCDYAGGDLYEAEEIYKGGHDMPQNRVVFVHYPHGEVYEPVILKKGQYFGRPVYYGGEIYILRVDFGREIIEILKFDKDMKGADIAADIPLASVADCYNLALYGSPLMLTRQGGDDKFQIIWPKHIEFEIAPTEAFMFRRGDNLYFSKWSEDTEYHEKTIVRDINTGKITDSFEGGTLIMPDGQIWNIS